MSFDALVIIVGLNVLAIASAVASIVVRRRKPPHLHCYHWMFTADAGRIVYQHCCQCGGVSATHVVGSWGEQPWRYADHGRFISYRAEVDYSKVRRFPGA